jgi:hypothetical protein
MHSKSTAKPTIEIPVDEYKILKEIYRTVKRQKLLFRIEEAEKNFRLGKVEKMSLDGFIENI